LIPFGKVQLLQPDGHNKMCHVLENTLSREALKSFWIFKLNLKNKKIKTKFKKKSQKIFFAYHPRQFKLLLAWE